MKSKNTNDEKTLIEVDKPLKRLRRNQLLELLLDASEENERLRQENKAVKEKYKQKMNIVKNSGSLAEASLKLTNIFEEAQKAVNIYVKNVQNENVQELQLEDEIEENMYPKFSSEEDEDNTNQEFGQNYINNEKQDYEPNYNTYTNEEYFQNEPSDLYNQEEPMTEEDKDYAQNFIIVEEVKVKKRGFSFIKFLEKFLKRGKHAKPRLLND